MENDAAAGKKLSSAMAKPSTVGGPDARPRRVVRGKDKIDKLGPKKTPRTRKPAEMGLEEWQAALRREFGREQNFRFKNVGDEPVFSEFIVSNPATKMDYRVAIRGKELGRNYCSCPDYAVNTLGTCKHIEFLFGKLERKSGGKAALREGFRPDYSEIYLCYGARRLVVFSPGTDCPAELNRLATRHFEEASGFRSGCGVLRRESFARFDSFLREAKRLESGLRCYDDALSYVAQVRDDNRRRSLIDKAYPEGEKSAALAKLVRVPLYAYQREGALFAARAGRSLIADDMGLGKTIQAIAAAEILARAVGIERVLIVSPTSLKYQWKQEIEKFCGRSAGIVEGLRGARAICYSTPSFYKITNYDTIHRDLDLIRRWEPDLIVLDEAQRIKNWKTRTAQSVKKLESEYAIVLTGTPLENRLEELHSIVEFVDRFRLGPSFRFLAEHQQVNEDGRVVGYRNLSTISQTLKPILLRREKKHVLSELPERLEKRFFVPMTEQQMVHHDENKDTVGRLVNKWRRVGFLTDKEQRILMLSLQNMRMSCNSTYLLDKKTDFGAKADELLDVLDDVFSGNGAKAVVFSQWTRMHELIIGRLKSKKIDHVFFHGGVPSRQRGELVRRFKSESSCRVFLSTDAGGVGLNLQNASAVVNMDQPWNPAVLEQRIGRVHRLGQHRPVQVVHFISQGTIEHGLLDVLAFKKSLFAGVLDGGENEVFLGGTKMKRFMETVEKCVDGDRKPVVVVPEKERAEERMPSAQQEPPMRPIPPTQAGTSPWATAAAAVAPSELGTSSAAADPSRATGASPATGSAFASGSLSEGAALTQLVTAGLSFLEKLGQAVATSRTAAGESEADRATPRERRASDPISQLVSIDKESGQPFLKLPMPKPDTVKKISDLLQSLIGSVSFPKS